MNKNKFGEETKWSLWKYQPDKNYPSTWYFWVDENNILRFKRSVEPIGFMPTFIHVIIELGDS
jgi:hypothetical protein